MTSNYKLDPSLNPPEIFKLKPLLACLRMVLAGGVFLGTLSTANAEGALPVPAENWVTGGSATNRIVGDALHIDQQSDRAVLNWKSFDVGEKNTVNFQQLSSSSIAMNRIGQNDPSQILGKITANGQVYLYNQNGFLFGKDSVVNVNTLVATALNVSDEVIMNGSIVTEYNNNNQRAAFSGRPKADTAIQVEAGANIKVDENGRLIMVAPNINNAGDLEADKFGQIILVASKDRVYLQPADPNSPFAGLLVEVDTGGRVSNIGKILARQGNVTLAGFAVNQEGRVNASTSVNVNGSIRLLAREGEILDGDTLAATRTTRIRDLQDGLGKESEVVFGPNSVTEIVADAEGGIAIDEQEQPLPHLEVSAHTVHLQSGAAIKSPSGQVAITATGNLLSPEQSRTGRILLEEGASIDVSGSKNITAPVERNVVDMSVQSFELRDSPRQKGGILQGQTIKVDIRKETPIVDISGALARVERGVEERLGKGGSVNFIASGDVIINAGAKIDISGGTITYEEGYLNTTRLITQYGAVVDIADAHPEQRYSAIHGQYTETSPKWGITRTWQVGGGGRGVFEPSYQKGLDAGRLNIQTTKLAWDGGLTAGSVAGFYQRGTDGRPFGGSLLVDTKTFNVIQGAVDTAQAVLFTQETSPPPIGIDNEFPVLENGRPAALALSATKINGSDLQNITVKALGQATLSDNAVVELAPGGQFKVVAGGIHVAGGIYAPGGDVVLSSGFDDAATEVTQRFFNPSAELTLAATANLDVSGRWVNDFALGLSATPTEAIAINAGSVNLVSMGNLFTETGSAIAANGGAWFSQNERLTAGQAGAIAITTLGGAGVATTLHLNGEQSAYGLSDGGALILTSSKIVVGAADETDLTDNPLVLGLQNNTLDLASIDSFGNIQLRGNLNDVVLKAGSTWNPIQRNFLLKPDFRGVASDGSISPVSEVATLPEHLRQPVDIGLTATRNLRLETGSQILADKQAKISLTSVEGSIYVDGILTAPAGSIGLVIDETPNPYNPSQAIWLAGNSRLDVTGTTRLNPTDGLGRRTGNVLDGGEVTFTARRGYVVQEQGSQIDVSGTKAILDLPIEKPNSLNYVPTEVGSNAGKITVVAAEGIVLDGGLKGEAGLATTRAGRLDLALDRTIRNPPLEIIDVFPFSPLVLSVQQRFQNTLDANSQLGDNLDHLGLNGKGLISVEQITAGGFGDLRLATFSTNPNGALAATGTVDFLGQVNLNAATGINIDSPNIGWRDLGDGALAEVKLNTPFFRAGSSNIRETDQLPIAGEGVITVNSKWSELEGVSRWNGFKTVNLASEHDLRAVGVLQIDGEVDGRQNTDYRGQLVTAADLNLTASQIYPTTLSKFAFEVTNPEGKITIMSSGNRDASPLSAAGELSFKASEIAQNGVVRAPFGTVNLTASKSLVLGGGSLTSVSGAGQLIPFGTTFSRLDWLYAVESNNILVFDAPPEKKLVLSSPKIALEDQSVVDVSGGGDLLAYEFQPGIGGSFDYLAPSSPSYKGGFAIVPGLGSALAPYDHLQRGHYPAAGSQVYLTGTDTLAAGYYTVLPPRYALLPGAYLVTPVANSQDQRAVTRNEAGLPIIPGYQALAGPGTRDARWRGFLIENGSDIRKRSQYDELTANEFFTQRAISKETAVPLLPRDSGQISIQNAQTKLSLEGELIVAATGGRGARLDISANHLKVVKELSETQTSGVLEILADDLTGLQVDSLFLGGERSVNSAGNTEFNISSTEVTFAHDAHLKVTDLIAAATEKVTVQSRAKLEASGSVNTGDSQFEIVGDGALLRVSADDQVVFNRTSTPGQKGELSVEAGSTLRSSNSILLDATQSTGLLGDIQMQGGSLNLSANAINLGAVDGLPSTALNLSNEKLLSLAVDDLILNSRNSIHIYGNLGERTAAGHYEPLVFKRLVMDAAGLVGIGEANQSVNIQAETLELSNRLGVVIADNGAGRADLNLSARDFYQGTGTFGINGFAATNVSVDNGFIATSDATLNVDSNFNLAAGYLTTTDGSTLAINAQGHHIQLDSKADVALTGINYGGAMNIVADSIGLNARLELPSGGLGLQSLKGDILIGADARINLSGDAVLFADTYDYTPGGVFSALADQGKITLAAGSKLDLSTGGGTAAGGSMRFQAVKKEVELLGEITAKAGSVVFDVANFSNQSNFDDLARKLADAGISDSIYIRVRDAAIAQIDSDIKANAITLVADRSAISISGKLDVNNGVPADGHADGGTVSLYAGDGIVLKDGAEITARGSGEGAEGGKVLLSSTDADNDQVSFIDVQSGAVIDVGGEGSVVFRALRTDNDADGVDDGVAIMPIKGEIKGFGQFYAEGVKKYGNNDLGNDGQIDLADINKIRTDTDRYMTAGTVQGVGGLGDGIRLRPGIEINYDGNLALAEKWDLVDWRYANPAGGASIPGALSINATGHFTFQQSLTDGFRTGSLVPGTAVRDILQTDDSWSYQLAAGADLTSADKTAVGNEHKELTLNPQSLIRTGTGDIHISSSGDVVFKDQGAAVYVAGKSAEGERFGSFGDLYVAFVFYGEYPGAGGDLSIRAGGDIHGALDQSPSVNNWYVRQGRWEERIPTAWAIDFAKFEQNLGAFGGGNISVSAGGNINDLAVMMPTTGKQVGELSDPLNPFSEFRTNEVDIQDAGQLQVSAGGNIAGGVYFLGGNLGNINASGKITGSSNPLLFSDTVQGLVEGPQFLMGDSRLLVNANQGIKLSAVTDPMILHNLNVNFFSYSEDSRLDVKSLSGDVTLNSDASIILSTFQATTGQASLSKIYPASLNATAFGGDVLIGGEDTDIILYPSKRGGLNIFARDAIAAGVEGIKRLGMSDFDPALLPGYQQPFSATALQSDANNIVALLNPFSTSSAVHALVPMHKDNLIPVRMVSQNGDIDSLIINLPKRAIVQSGRDFTNVSLEIQHANESGDYSIISAGRDIIYPTLRNADFGTLVANTNRIEIGGSGNVLVKSDRNIDLGTSIGLSSVGNTFNPNLPSAGSNVTVLVGLNGREPDFLGLRSLDPNVLRYAENYYEFQILVTDFMRQRTGNPSLAVKTALAEFYTLNPNEYVSLQPALDVIRSEKYYDLLKRMENVIVNFVRDRQGEDLTRAQALEVFKGLDSNQYLSIQPRLNTLANRMLFSIQNTTGSSIAVDQDSTARSRAVSSLNERLAKSVDYAIGDGTGFAPLKVGNESGFAAINALYPVDRVYNLVGRNPETIGPILAEPEAFDQVGQDLTTFVENWKTVDPSINNENVVAEFIKLTATDYLAIKDEIAQSQQDIKPTYFADKPINPTYLGHEWNGDLNLFFSKLQTLRGGSINMLVPGGDINAGLAVVANDLQKSSADLGIVVQGEGGINAFLNNDFIVNQSRVFALSGGDIMIWSSVGDIDAGRGAKSAIAAPPPIISFDQSGNLVITFPPITSGSGIRTAAPIGEDTLPGDVALFAPGGIVNAGEAGIGGNNVTIAATAVLGANNIQVGGVATGVPAASSVSLAAGLTGVSNLTAGVVQAAESLTDMTRDKEEAASERGMKLGTLSVELMGFGYAGASAGDKEKN